MKFEEALKELREGKHLTRSHWVNGPFLYILVNEIRKSRICVSPPSIEFTPELWRPVLEDIMATDWEIVSLGARLKMELNNG